MQDEDRADYGHSINYGISMEYCQTINIYVFEHRNSNKSSAKYWTVMSSNP